MSSRMKDIFLERVQSGDAIIGIVGMGYVGVPLAEAYTGKGVSVLGYDINKTRVDDLLAGRSGMKHIGPDRIRTMLDSGKFDVTANPARLSEADAILICVPTPLDHHQQPDLTYVQNTCDLLKDHIRKGQIIVLESTTYPGTTTDVMLPILEQSGLTAGVDFALAYSPEREDPGNPDFETSTIPKVVGADSDDERVMAKSIYDLIVDTVMVSNTRTAEATKLVENIFRWVNIAMVNELKVVFEHMDIDVWEVIDAAATKPFGFMPFYPGPGVGGHCIRIDPYYLTWKAREHGVTTRFIELAGEINVRMPERVVGRLMEELSQRQGKALHGAKVLLCGIAYKKNIDDMRESPALDLITRLQAQGAEVDYYDPFVHVIPTNREHPSLSGMKSVPWDLEVMGTYDACLVATDHTEVDYEALVKAIPLMVDTRNVSRELIRTYPERIVKA